MTMASAQKQSPALLTHMDLKKMANAIRALAMDAVEKANSGHPGMPMGMADVATILFSKFLKFDPTNPTWPDRDRFILSAGHGSMLLYALNYLTGYEKISLDAIKNFRQLHSITAGHPEIMPEAGIETTTGPLGQGISTAVGFALGERILAARFGEKLVDHHTFVIASDGDLMEGISHEACALAGHLKLSRLIVLYDDNGITIDGSTALSYTENVTKRFEAYGWDVQEIDGHNFDQIEAAIDRAMTTPTPSIIRCKTKIGFGAGKKEGSHDSHGSPLGSETIAQARINLDWPYAPFEIPNDILDMWRAVGARNLKTRQLWDQNNTDENFKVALSGDIDSRLTDAIKDAIASFLANPAPLATRKASMNVLEYLVPKIPEMIGGSADLTGSNLTKIKGPAIISASSNYHGQYIHYGVREHGMAACMNGLSQHGGLIPYGGTFLCFADYCRPSIRLAALMKTRSIFVMTHDSIGLGEDGPTHQPVEHLAALRAIPNCLVLRPCDGVETAECWDIALRKKDGPSVLVLTRHNLKPQRLEQKPENLSARGAYIISPASNPRAAIFATGSEVEIAVEAQKLLAAQNISAQVVSVPSFELFRKQDDAYKASVLGPAGCVRIGVEAAIRMGWDEFIGSDAPFIGMTSFGESAPYQKLYDYFGITAERVANAVSRKLG